MRKMGSKERDRIIVTIETPDFKIPFDLNHVFRKRQNLKRAAITPDEVKEINPSFFKINPEWYTELGVASSEHTTAGSLGWDALTYGGESISVQLIPYYDSNVKKDHYKGLPHFNIGGRIIDKHGKDHLVRELKGINHTIPDCPWIKLTMNPGPEGKCVSIKLERPK